MKRFKFMFFGLFFVFGVNIAQKYEYHHNDLDCLLKFMYSFAADEKGRAKETNAEVLLGIPPNYLYTSLYWVDVLNERGIVVWDDFVEEGVTTRRITTIQLSGVDKKQPEKRLSGELNFMYCKFLNHIQCCNEKITAVNLDSCENLTTVLLEYNMISRANFDNCDNINIIKIGGNQLLPSEIKLTRLPREGFIFDGQTIDKFDYTIVYENGDLYYKVDLSAQLENEFLLKNFDRGLAPDYNSNSSDIIGADGIFYFNVDKILNPNYTIRFNIVYRGRKDKVSQGNLEFETDIFNTLWPIEISTNPMPSGSALACIYWVEDDNYFLIDTAKNYGRSFINTRLLPPGEYIVLVDAADYLCAYYADSYDSPVRSWKDERIKKVSPGDKIKITLDKKRVLKDEGISITGNLTKSTIKATARVLQRSTVTLHSSSKTTAQKAAGDDWIWVATTQTDEYGAYSFPNLPRDTYRVTVEMPGYEASQPIIILATTEGTIHGNQNFIVYEAEKYISANGDVVSGYLSNDEIQLSVYPNPVTDMVHIDGLEGAYTVKIINIMGQVLQSVTGSSPELTLYLNNLSPGMYLLRIESQGRARTVKLIKN